MPKARMTRDGSESGAEWAWRKSRTSPRKVSTARGKNPSRADAHRLAELLPKMKLANQGIKANRNFIPARASLSLPPLPPASGSAVCTLAPLHIGPLHAQLPAHQSVMLPIARPPPCTPVRHTLPTARRSTMCLQSLPPAPCSLQPVVGWD